MLSERARVLGSRTSVRWEELFLEGRTRIGARLRRGTSRVKEAKHGACEVKAGLRGRGEVEHTYCPHCNLEYPAGAAFCMACGGQLVSRPLVESAIMTCSQCGSRPQIGSRFCDQCGAPLSAPSEEPKAVLTKQCSYCGAPLLVAEGVFCMSCGARLEPEEEAAPAVPAEAQRCPHCGEVVVEKEAAFCPFCGRTMVEAAPPPSPAAVRERVLCPHCHAEVEAEMAFCLFCGARLVAPPVVETAEATKQVVLCQHCSASVEEGVEVCPACGYSMLAEEPSALSKVKAGPSETVEVAKEEEATSTGTVEVVSVCPQCSAPLKGGIQICAVCGYQAEERPSRRRWVWVAAAAILLSGVGVGGWYAYHHHAPTRAVVDRALFKIGVFKSNLIILSSPPECEVFLNGEARGATDATGRLVLTGLEKGSYVIRLTRKGFEAQEQRIEVTEPEVTITVSLVPEGPEGMVFIPGGTFRMGRDEGDEYERPAHEVTVAPFFIDRTEVTNLQYYQFLKATGHPAPAHWSWGIYPSGQDNWPVTNVSWRDAESYCRWAGKRLPTEEEWEFAARGTDGRLYPWGNQWRPNAANAATTSSGGPAPVGSYPEGASPFKVLDMVGNVWEWTASTLRAYPGGRIPEDTLPESERQKLKVIRGGCYLSSAQQATTTYRMGWPEYGADYAQTGFRCAKEVKQQ